MRIDWQAYDAGMLTGDELTRAEQLLADSEEARGELAGLRRFKKLVHSTKYAERVPALKVKVRAPGIQGVRWATTGALAATLAVIALGVSTGSLQRFVFGEEKKVTLSSSDVTQTDTFLRSRTRIGVKSLDPAPVAVLNSVSCNSREVNYVMTRNGRSFTFSVTVSPKPIAANQFSDDGRRYLVREHDGVGRIGWRDNGLQFMITGLPLKEAWPVATDFRAKTLSWTAESK